MRRLRTPRFFVTACFLSVVSAGCGGRSGSEPDSGTPFDGSLDVGGELDSGGEPDGGDSDAGTGDAGADAMVPQEATLVADEPSAALGELLVASSTAVDVVFRNVGEAESGTLTTALLGDPTFGVESDSCSGAMLGGGETCTVRVVASSSAEASGTVTVRLTGTPGGAAETTVTATYVRPYALSVDDDDHDFGQLLVGLDASKVFRVSNTGGQVSPTIEALTVSDAGYAIAADTCSGNAVPRGDHCEFTIVFRPTSAGATSSTTSIVAGPVSLRVDARGVGQAPASLSFTASAPSFPATLLGASSATIAYTLTNDGDVPSGALVTSLSGSDADEFDVVTDACDGATLDPATSCEITVRFSPANGRGQKQASVGAAGTPGGAVSSTLTGVALADALLSESEGPHHFGIEEVLGVSTAHEFVVMNAGDVSSGAVTVSLSGPDANQFAIGSGSCAAPVQGASGCSVFVTFRPTRFGPASATVQVSSTPGGMVSFEVDGTGEDHVALHIETPLGGGGMGSVSGGGIQCPGGACSVLLARSTANPSITLTATPAASSDFAGWSGACASFGVAASCTLTLSSASTSVGAAFDLEVYPVVVLRTDIDGATGGVRSVSTPQASTDFSCGETCEIMVTHGTVLELRASPGAGSFFGGFGGGCVSTTRRCTLTVTEPTEVEAYFTPANRSFTTPLTYTVSETKAFATDTSSEAARMLSGADAICRAVGGSPDFHAFLGAVGVSPYTRIPGAPRGFLRADGRPFKGDLTHGSPTYYPPSLDASGTAVSNVSSSQVWSGVGPGGTTTSATTCGNWSGSGLVAIGPYEGVGNTWSSYASASCNGATRHHFVCLEARYRADVSPGPAPANARVAFVSNATYDPATGVAGADALCDAEAASLPGSFRAMIATSTASMASRFTHDSRPVHRPDGLFIAANSAALLSVALPLAPIAVNANAQSVEALVWVGSSDPTTPGDTTTTCYVAGPGSWATADSAVSGRLGFSAQRDAMLASAWFPCSWASGHVYCLEE